MIVCVCECAVYVCSESEYINVIIFVVLAFSGLYCEYVSISELFCCLWKGNGGRMNFIGDEYNNNYRLYGMFTLLSLLCSCFCCCWRVVVFLSKVVCVHKFKHLLEGRPFFVVSAVAVAVFVRGNSGDRLAVRLAECINIHYPIRWCFRLLLLCSSLWWWWWFRVCFLSYGGWRPDFCFSCVVVVVLCNTDGKDDVVARLLEIQRPKWWRFVVTLSLEVGWLWLLIHIIVFYKYVGLFRYVCTYVLCVAA